MTHKIIEISESLHDFIKLAQAKLNGRLPESSIPTFMPKNDQIFRW